MDASTKARLTARIHDLTSRGRDKVNFGEWIQRQIEAITRRGVPPRTEPYFHYHEGVINGWKFGIVTVAREIYSNDHPIWSLIKKFEDMSRETAVDTGLGLLDSMRFSLQEMRNDTSDTKTISTRVELQRPISHITHFHAPVGGVVTNPQESTVHQHQVNYGISAGDIDSLISSFRKARVPENDISALKAAIANDERPISPNQFGHEVQNWIGGMIIKAGSAAWNFARDKSAELLMDAINAYYGFHL